MLISHESALYTTPLALLGEYVSNRYVLASILFTISIIAIYGTWNEHRWINKWYSIYFIIGQQIILFLSAYSSLEAMYLKQFADGVIRDFEFIASDRMGEVVFAFIHLFVILQSKGVTLENIIKGIKIVYLESME